MLSRRTALITFATGAFALTTRVVVAKGRDIHIPGIVLFKGPGFLPPGVVTIKLVDGPKNGETGAATIVAAVSSGAGDQTQVRFRAAVPTDVVSSMREPRLIAEFEGNGPYRSKSLAAPLEPNLVLELASIAV